jgi:RNA polymerase sigma factor (sigma-70 family)
MPEPDRDIEKTNELIRAAKGGDERARETLFARYLPRVRLIVASRAGWSWNEMEDVEDLVQEALLKALGSFQGFEVRDEGGFRNFLACCVQSAIADALRRRKSKKRAEGRVRRFSELYASGCLVAEILGESREPRASAILAAAELDGRIQEALGRLPEHYREVIIFARICEMPLRDVAAAMNLSYGNVRILLMRALEKLRRALEVEEDPE